MKKTLLLIVVAVLLPNMALALLRAYAVDPVKAQWSGWTRRNDAISQTITCNFDSLVRVELFAGYHGTGSGYNLEVRDQHTNTLIARQSNLIPGQDHTWQRFSQIEILGHFTKGKVYEFRFTRSGSDSIQYYYNPNNPYGYGQIQVGGGSWNQNEPVNSCDLCIRIYGILRPVEKTFFGMDEHNFVPWSDTDRVNRNRLRCENGHLADSAGIGSMMLSYLRWQDMCWDTLPRPGCTLEYVRWCDYDARLWVIIREAHARPVVSIVGVAPYASSRDTFVMKRIWVPDTSGNTAIHHWEYIDTIREKTPYCAPLGLWKPDSTNYWKMFIYSMITHLDGDLNRRGLWPGNTGRPYDNVHIFEIWNEPNDSCPVTCRRHVDACVTGWWRRPNREYEPADYPGLYGLCCLYVRMAYVAESVIHSQPGHENDTILIGAVHRCFDFDTGDMGLSKGIEFIRNCYQIAMSEYGKIFWNGVSIHPYQNGHDFNPVTFEIMAESVRAIAREYCDYDCLVWNSEAGVLDYAGWDPETVKLYHQGDARRYLPQMYATGIASAGLPGARYDACQWWWYSTGVGDSFGLIGLRGVDPQRDSFWDNAYWEKFSAYYAVKQMTEELIGWQYESRISLGDSVRIYQFTHPADGRRKWVGWRVQDEGRHSPKSVLGFVPVRTDSVYVTDELGTILGLFSADETGWFVDSLGPMVTYIKEPHTQILRPDLRVDSIRLVPSQPQVGMPLDIYFWVKNCGTRSLPAGSPGGIAVYRNGVRLEPLVHLPSDAAIEQNCERVFAFHIEAVPDTWRGPNLFEVVVNPNRDFVELEFDDNAGYIYTTISLLPEVRFYAILSKGASKKQHRS